MFARACRPPAASSGKLFLVPAARAVVPKSSSCNPILLQAASWSSIGHSSSSLHRAGTAGYLVPSRSDCPTRPSGCRSHNRSFSHSSIHNSTMADISAQLRELSTCEVRSCIIDLQGRSPLLPLPVPPVPSSKRLTTRFRMRSSRWVCRAVVSSQTSRCTRLFTRRATLESLALHSPSR